MAHSLLPVLLAKNPLELADKESPGNRISTGRRPVASHSPGHRQKLNLPVSDCMDKIVPAFQKQIDPNIQTVDEALIFMMNRIKADHEAKKTQEMRKKVDASQNDLQSRPDVLRDHEGRCFSSKNQMARYHGLSHATLRFRLEQDMDLQEALTKPVRQPGCTDHEGRRFDTVHEMAAWYGIKYATLEQRLGSGMPLDKALTTLPRIRSSTTN